MKKNVTYLFGAGASANALPTVNFFNKRLELFLKSLGDNNRNEKIAAFIPEVLMILEESRKHSTIDTVAKKYFHNHRNRQQDLIRLKKVIGTK